MPTRYVPAPALRARPDRKGGGRPRPPVQSGVALRLAIGREGIGLELAQPAVLGCVTVTDLAATLPGIRFPVDVSGGVPRFRHRRGELQRLELEIPVRGLERWAAPRVRGLVGTRSPDVWVAVDGAGATASVVGEADVEEESGVLAEPVLVFEVRALAEGDVLTLVVERARGTGLPLPATALALSCVEAVLGPVAERLGAVFRISGPAASVARALLPEAGARVPGADRMSWTSVAAAGDAWVLHALHGAVSAPPSPEALRARELAMLLREADDRLVAGDLTAARALCVDAMGRAPRHPEIARRIVEIDAREGGRAEAALAMLVEARFEGEARFGTTPGELLLEVGDLEAALASLEHAGETEPAPALAGRAFELAASAVRDPDEAARWLDHAVARAPRSTSARWLRVSKRVTLGRLEDAIADVEHLEAMARSGKAKHRVWLRAGGVWHAAGLATHAGALFERALRFVPDEPRALAGLGVALVGQGREARGVAVLARALEVAEARGEPTSAIRLDLASALADRLDDRSTAVAHVAAIPRDAPEAPVARGLEGRWRAHLGDLAGAALAYARLRELAGSMGSGSDDSRAQVAALLLEGAEVERTQLHDPLAAQRHLATALRLRPHDPDLLRAYREVGELVAGAGGAEGPEEGALPPPVGEFGEHEEASATHRTAVTDRPVLDLSLPADVDLEAAARVEELTRLLQGDPRNDAVADELATHLETLGRGHELLALMSARLEDATPERRVELLPRARAALERLAADAERAGRREEAALYRSALDSLTT
jgi:cellulose synthase operon protein C